MALLPSLNFDVPGVYVSEDQFGVVPASLASHSAVYMLGYSSKSGAPLMTPTFIQSPTDFNNVFGTNLSSDSVKLFFDQRSGSGLWFVNVPRRDKYTVSIATAVVGASYTLTIGGYTLTYVALVSDTPATILKSLDSLVNSKAFHSAFMINGDLRVASSVTVTASANVTLSAKTAAGSYPVVEDVLETLNKAFDPSIRQGFLIAPEFFQSFTSSTERANLAKGMESLAADPEYNWLALIDCGAFFPSGVGGAGALNAALYDRSLQPSPKGHSAYFFPYWENTSGAYVPMSASVAGVALRRYRQQGYRQPPAGVTFPVYGVTGAAFNVTDKVQGILNPEGINCGRVLPNKGAVIYGARTLSTSPYYRFMTTRVILNVLSGTLSRAFDEVVFSSVDGQGALFGRIKQTAIGICERLRQAGALFGATPEEAYLVVCDRTNNPPLDLERGVVSCDVIVKPSPILEALSIRVSRAALGATLTEAVASGESSTVANSPTTTTTTP